MNTENFKEFLENPSRLYQLSYQELKSLVLQYPYSANLHYLLLQKSAMENHRDLKPNQQKAATYSLDRTFLFNLIRELTLADKKEPILQLDEEFLELKDLSVLEADLLTKSVPDDLQETSPSALPLVDFPALDLEITNLEEDKSEELDLSPTFTPPSLEEIKEDDIKPGLSNIQVQNEVEEIQESKVAPEAPISSSFQIPEKLIGTAASISSVIQQFHYNHSPQKGTNELEIAPPDLVSSSDPISPSLEKQKQVLYKLDNLLTERAVHIATATVIKKPAPRPKGSFTSWVQQFQSDQIKHQLGDLMEARKREELKRLKKKKKKAKKKKKKVGADYSTIEFAEKSLTKHQTIVSETLAELLAEQGEIDKSLKMYERLKLYFPEKSAYFAAIIEKLKTE